MLGTFLEVLDSSIVNVSLPHMQGSFSASVDEISWVLTSYLAANGIMIPMTGWISARFGRKRYFLTSMFLFLIASALCGAARSLGHWTLVGCTVAPAFEFTSFELAPSGWEPPGDGP